MIEEYLRFGCDNAYLARLCKELRHDVAHWAQQFSVEELHAARDTQHDVGTQFGTVAEYQRTDIDAVVAANCNRVQQALRALEEYGKIVAPGSARPMEQLRYRAYMLERAITTQQRSCRQFDQVHLYVLIDGQADVDRFSRLVQDVIRGGADMIQLRDKQLNDADLLQRARAARELTRRANVYLIINDRPDLAVAADADGVHLGQDDLPINVARRIVGSAQWIGMSTHCIAQVENAVCDGADYIGCGPTFPSTTKTFSEFPGLSFLQQISADFCIPAFAIGGINTTNVDAVVANGLRRVAVSHAITAATDPAEATRQIRHGLLPTAPDRHQTTPASNGRP